MTTPLTHQWKQIPVGYSIEQWLAAHPADDWVWQMLFHSGQTNSEAAEFQISGLGNSTQTYSYSHLFLYVPPTWFIEQQSAGLDPISLYLRWAEIMQATHGTAGLGLVPSEDTPIRGRTSPVARAFAWQFPGVELADALGNQNVFWGLLSANWLNLVDASHVDRLGGIGGIERQLAGERMGELVTLHSFNGGVLLASGTAPQLCEGGEGGKPPHVYGPVARLLKPFRTDRPWGCWGCPKDESLEWLARYDQV
jgi:Protein of unknown function (DUF3396)